MRRKKRYNILHINRELINDRKTIEPSRGETRVIDILTRHKILFKREYYIQSLFDRQTNGLLFFDFYLPAYRVYIEFDGKHHYEPIYGLQKFYATKRHDQMKNKFCSRKNRLLLRIPYWCPDIEVLILRFLEFHFPTRIQC